MQNSVVLTQILAKIYKLRLKEWVIIKCHIIITVTSRNCFMFRVLFNLLALVRTRHFCIHLQAILSRGTLPVSLTKDYGLFLRKGPNTDFHPGLILLTKCRSVVEEALQTYCKRWCKMKGVEVHALNDWKNEYLRIVDIRIENFTTYPHLYKQPSGRSVEALKRKMKKKIHSKYVFAPADYAANNVTIIWKKDTTWKF